MSGLEDICREAAEGIDGCAVLPGGGLSFARRGFPARLDFFGGMNVLIDTRGLTAEAIRVTPFGFWDGVRLLFFRREFEVGDPEFDERFSVRTSNEAFAREILRPELRGVLRMLHPFGGFVWRLSGAGFMLRADVVPRKAIDIDRWLVAAFQLLDAIPGVDEFGKVRLDAVATRPDLEPRCLICGTALARGRTVRCARCATPHHEECWTFNGRCSTFACGEIAFRG